MTQLKDFTNDDLAGAWMAAKQAEEKANAERLAIEQEIVARFGQKEEGAETHTLDSGFKIEVTGRMSYKVEDMPLLERLLLDAKVPATLWPLKSETKLDETGAKWLRNSQPDVWRSIAPAITIKPAKTAVKVKV